MKYLYRKECENRGTAYLSWIGHGKSKNDMLSPRLDYRDDLGRWWLIYGYDLKSLVKQFKRDFDPKLDGVKTLSADSRTSVECLKRIAKILGLKADIKNRNKWGFK